MSAYNNYSGFNPYMNNYQPQYYQQMQQRPMMQQQPQQVE